MPFEVRNRRVIFSRSDWKRFENFTFCAGGGDNNAHCEDFDDKLYLTLEPKFRPLEPDMSDEAGVKFFEEHKEVSWNKLSIFSSIRDSYKA